VAVVFRASHLPCGRGKKLGEYYRIIQAGDEARRYISGAGVIVNNKTTFLVRANLMP
jgi:hypothetical protein